MKDLKVTLAYLGCEQVSTYIQSGNVVFQHQIEDRFLLSQKIEAAVHENHGLHSQVLVIGAELLARIIAANPFDTEVGKALHFYFLPEAANQPNIEKLMQLQSSTESFRLTDEVFYLYAPDGVGRSKLAAKVESCLGISVTARNWNTVSKLSKMVSLLE